MNAFPSATQPPPQQQPSPMSAMTMNPQQPIGVVHPQQQHELQSTISAPQMVQQQPLQQNVVVPPAIDLAHKSLVPPAAANSNIIGTSTNNHDAQPTTTTTTQHPAAGAGTGFGQSILSLNSSNTYSDNDDDDEGEVTITSTDHAPKEGDEDEEENLLDENGNPRQGVELRSKNVYFNYLPLEFTDADLNTLCAKFGAVVSVKVTCSKKGGNVFGFCLFEGEDAAAKAIEELNETTLEESPQPLEVRTASVNATCSMAKQKANGPVKKKKKSKKKKTISSSLGQHPSSMNSIGEIAPIRHQPVLLQQPQAHQQAQQYVYNPATGTYHIVSTQPPPQQYIYQQPMTAAPQMIYAQQPQPMYHHAPPPAMMAPMAATQQFMLPPGQQPQPHPQQQQQPQQFFAPPQQPQAQGGHIVPVLDVQQQPPQQPPMLPPGGNQSPSTSMQSISEYMTPPAASLAQPQTQPPQAQAPQQAGAVQQQPASGTGSPLTSIRGPAGSSQFLTSTPSMGRTTSQMSSGSLASFGAPGGVVQQQQVPAQAGAPSMPLPPATPEGTPFQAPPPPSAPTPFSPPPPQMFAPPQ